MFTPKLFKQQQYCLSGKTAADAFEAERMLIKLDEHLAYMPLGPAVTDAMARLEAISTVRIDGLSPRSKDLLVLDSLFNSEQTRYFNYDITESNFCTKSASLEAFYYLETLRWITDTVHLGFQFSPQFILDVHSRCLYNKIASETGIRFREKNFEQGKDAQSTGTFQPPSADELMDYLTDLCDFINTPCFSPIVQVGYMHFQFESIKPFRAAMDRTGRALCHALFRARGLTENVIPPIALLPAIDTTYHAVSLLPYDKTENFEESNTPAVLNRWIEFCADSTSAIQKIEKNYLNIFEALKNHWNEQVGKLSEGSVARTILDYLPGHPILTVEAACKFTGKSFGACNDALKRLENDGVLTLIDNKGSTNTRLFEAKKATTALNRMEETLFSSPPVSRSLVKPV